MPKYSDPLVTPTDTSPKLYMKMPAYLREKIRQKCLREDDLRQARLYEPLPGQKRPTKTEMLLWERQRVGGGTSDWDPGEEAAQDRYIAYLNAHHGEPPPRAPKKVGRPGALEPLNARIQINVTVRQAAAIALLAAGEGLTTPAWVAKVVKATMEAQGQWPTPLEAVEKKA